MPKRSGNIPSGEDKEAATRQGGGTGGWIDDEEPAINFRHAEIRPDTENALTRVLRDQKRKPRTR